MAGQKEGWQEVEEAAALGKDTSPRYVHKSAWADGEKGGCKRKAAEGSCLYI